MKNLSRTKKITTSFIAVLSLLFVICVSCFLISMYKDVFDASAETVTVENTGIEDEYTFGTTITISEAEMDIGGSKQMVFPKLYLPDGSAKIVSEIELSQLGKYTLEYSAEKDGVIYAYKKDFSVHEYSWWSGNGTALKYGEPKNYEVTGLNFSVYEGDKVNYRKIYDMSKLTEDDVLISIDATPTNPGTPESRRLFVRFTDVYDPTNYVTVRMSRRVSGKDILNDGSMMASFGSMPFSGWLKPAGKEEKLYTDGETGAVIYNGLTGSWGGKGNKKDVQHIEIKFDYASGRIYTFYRDGTQRKVVNLYNDFYERWQGFTTGEVYISIWAEDYTDSRLPFNGIILSLFGEDLSKDADENGNVPIVYVNEATDFNIDFGKYETADNIPNAMVGYPYKIFDTDVDFSIYGNEKVTSRVYYGYYTNTRSRVNVIDGKFIPQYDGIYTIVYTLTDIFGNQVQKTLDVYAREEGTATFDMVVNGYEEHQSGTVGESFVIPGVNNVVPDGNIGFVDLTITAENSTYNDFITVKGDSFIPYHGGTWVIKYSAVDAIGRTSQWSYEANIVISEKVTFNTIKDFPKYAILGTKNQLPLLTYIDYNLNGAIKTVDHVYAEINGTREAEIIDGVFTPATTGDYTIVYEGISNVGVSNTVSYPIKAVDVGFGDTSNFSLGKYFYTEGQFSFVGKAANIEFTSGDNVTAEFIRPIDLTNFIISFTIKESDVESMEFTLTDLNDKSCAIKFVISKNGDNATSTILINDSISYFLDDNTFFGGEFKVQLVKNVMYVGKKSFTINKDYSGKDFVGFSSYVGYMTIKTNLTNETGTGIFTIKTINNQNVNGNVKSDKKDPLVMINTEDFGTKYLGDTITISASKITDIIDPYVVSSMSILDKDDKPVTDVNGRLIEKVSIDQDYSFVSTKMGRHKVVFYFSDQAGNGSGTEGADVSFTVIDRTPPDITLQKNTETVRQGAIIRIPTLTINDTDKKVNVNILVQEPNRRMNELKKVGDEYVSTITAKYKGTYIIRFLAVDEWGNMNYADYKVTVI